MRITDTMISKSMLANVGRVRQQLANLQADLATTKKLRQPSDDPSGFSRAVNFNNLIKKNEQYLRNIRDAAARVTQTLSALDSASEIVVRAKELATQAASETMDADARATLADEVGQLLDALLSVANTTHSGKYLFAGTATVGQPPFVLEDGQVRYQGNAGVVKARIGETSEAAVNRPGDVAFQQANGVDVFEALLTVKQALESNDTDGIEATLDKLDRGYQGLVALGSEFGALQNRLSLAEEFLEARNVELADFASQIEDTDMVEATIRFQDAENALTFAMRSYSDLIQTSLLNFLS